MNPKSNIVKVTLEDIRPDTDRSFRLLLTPRLNEVFFWHYHPEYELIYIEGTDGIRHIGNHLARYEGSDLAFIGPYIPHLNFDYGVRQEHQKIVVQLREDFMGPEFLQKPELLHIRQLFERAKGALAFSGDTKRQVGERLKQLPEQTPFGQLMTLLDIFQMLAAGATDTLVLGESPIASERDFLEQQRLKKIQYYVAAHFKEPIEMGALTELTHLSTAAFCRYFKKAGGQTFTDYLSQYRIQQAKKQLLQGATVTEACFGSGFENLSHFNKTFKKWSGENPLRFKKRHLGAAG